jgi:signal transduction histidine kinase
LSIYEWGWDQGLLFLGEFVAISLLHVGFMQVVIGQTHNSQREDDQQSAREQERLRLLGKHQQDLQALLTEREEIIRQLTLSNKSAGMGALVASFAHELNQPLTATLIHAEWVGHQAQQSEVDLPLIQEVAGFIVKDTQRAGEIIRKLRNLFRMGKGEFKRMDFALLVRDVLDMVQSKLQHEQIELFTHLESGLQLTGDATQLQQVVLNLINNAIDAMAGVQRQARRLQVVGEVDAHHVVLHIIDNGPGIPLDQQEGVFSLFKTSKSEGMGVGLWLSQSIVETHGGLLTFSTQLGLGCTFSLKLPRAEYVTA